MSNTRATSRSKSTFATFTRPEDCQISERHCHAENKKFLCKDGKKCLKSDLVCDGIEDCDDGSDEFNFCGVKSEGCKNMVRG